MRTAAEAHVEEDKKRLEEVEARNHLDNQVYQAEKLLRENREKIGEAEVKPVEEAIASAKQAMNDGGADRMKSATEALERSLHKVGEVLYRAGAQAGGAAGASGGAPAADGAGASAGGSKGQGDVIDA